MKLLGQLVASDLVYAALKVRGVSVGVVVSQQPALFRPCYQRMRTLVGSARLDLLELQTELYPQVGPTAVSF